MNRIDLKFKDLRKQNKKAFIAFITAGFPSLEITEKLVIEFDRIGVDIVELGVPFSDPIADGPVIQNASFEALKELVNLKKIFTTVKKIRQKSQIPIALMSYYNPILNFTEKEFVLEAQKSGADAVIVPDLPFEEAGNLTGISKKLDFKNIVFVAPTSSKQRIRQAVKNADGFIYYVSLAGVTGSRKNLSADLKSRVLALKKLTNKPVCVGFGVSDKKQVKEISGFADGVIIGSAIVKEIAKYKNDKNLIGKISKFVQGLKNV